MSIHSPYAQISRKLSPTTPRHPCDFRHIFTPAAHVLTWVVHLACLQVKHFDAQQETLARKVKYLAKAIDGKASTAAGTLSGKSQI